jgi:hypothetical protein
MNVGKLFILSYLGRIVWKLSLQDKFFLQITNYQSFQNNQVNLYKFFFLGTWVQINIWNIMKFWIIVLN